MEGDKKLKILMLEDNGDDAALIERVMRKANLTFVTKRVDTRAEFDDAIRTFIPDVILSDHGLPQFNSVEALKIASTSCKHAPFILVTGTVSEEFATTCLKMGANDYILKSNLSRLPNSILRAVKERRLEVLKRDARRALRKQNEELMKVNHELDNFVYSVSHNLRAPLTSVLGLLNLAAHDQQDKKIAPLHEMMRTSIVNLDKTLSDILQYSKNARSNVQTEEVSWSELIHESIDKLQYLENSRNISWQIDVRQNEPFYSDKDRLSTALTNILSNAILYSQTNRSSVVTIKADISTTQGTIIIQDNGIGIREDLQPRIYDMFFRGTERSQGAGLGLYITREIMKRLNATISISSVHNNGTTVSITIPNNREQEEE
jgi:signal transduction histidine kinase